MKSQALTLTAEHLEEMLAAHLSRTLTPERIEAIAERAIAARIGQLTLEEAAKHLGCKNPRQLEDFCRENSIPLRHYSRKKRFILLADIEAAQKRAAVMFTDAEAPAGTKVERLAA